MREELANYAHSAWSSRMKYLFLVSSQNDDGTVTIPVWAVKRWKKRMNTPYEALSEGKKDSDRDEADKMIDIVNGNSEL